MRTQERSRRRDWLALPRFPDLFAECPVTHKPSRPSLRSITDRMLRSSYRSLTSSWFRSMASVTTMPRGTTRRHLIALGAHGATAPEGMIPSYPSITFPNHYTIVTGLYPEHHGIVANSFYDPAREETYDYRDSASVTDGTWYGGTPLWALAEQQGMRSASFFWVGSEAEIQGTRPTYYLKYDDKFPNQKRVDQVLAWLRLPPGTASRTSSRYIFPIPTTPATSLVPTAHRLLKRCTSWTTRLAGCFLASSS